MLLSSRIFHRIFHINLFRETIHMMKLIGTVTSPYTRKVRVVLVEKRMECEFVTDSPNTPDSEVIRYNPLGKIPVLVLDDEHTIFDSRVIVENLDNASPGNRLIPEEKRPRIQVRRWEALADGCTDAVIALVNEKKSRPNSNRRSGSPVSRARSNAHCRQWRMISRPRRGVPVISSRSRISRSAAVWAGWNCACPICRGGAIIRIWRGSRTSWPSVRRSRTPRPDPLISCCRREFPADRHRPSTARAAPDVPTR